MPKPPPAQPVTPMLFTVETACTALAVHRSTLYRALAEGRLHARKLRGRLVITRGELERFVAELPPAEFTPPPKSGR